MGGARVVAREVEAEVGSMGLGGGLGVRGWCLVRGKE